MSLEVKLSNYDDVIKGLDACKKDLAKGVRRTLNDMARREANTVAGTEVAKFYNIQKGDVTEKFTGYKVVDSIHLAGVNIDCYELTWKGRNLMPTHFSMSVLKRGTVKWKPHKKGAKEVLKHIDYPQASIFIAKGLPFIRLPYARAKKTQKGWSTLPIDAVRSHLSVPQMIDNENVNPKIEKEIDKRINAKLNKYIK